MSSTRISVEKLWNEGHTFEERLPNPVLCLSSK